MPPTEGLRRAPIERLIICAPRTTKVPKLNNSVNKLLEASSVTLLCQFTPTFPNLLFPFADAIAVTNVPCSGNRLIGISHGISPVIRSSKSDKASSKLINDRSKNPIVLSRN